MMFYVNRIESCKGIIEQYNQNTITASQTAACILMMASSFECLSDYTIFSVFCLSYITSVVFLIFCKYLRINKRLYLQYAEVNFLVFYF